MTLVALASARCPLRISTPGPYQTSLAADELIVSTRWPVAAPGEGRAFTELAQRHGDFTLGIGGLYRDGA